jgi:hypothetical protein
MCAGRSEGKAAGQHSGRVFGTHRKATKNLVRSRPLQDEATRAWNLHGALYYKAGGTPWRLPRQSSDLATCFIGVSFFRTTDSSELHTAVAQVFNERGDGVVVRGAAAAISKADRQPHLSSADSAQLLTDGLDEDKRVHGNCLRGSPRTRPRRSTTTNVSASGRQSPRKASTTKTCSGYSDGQRRGSSGQESFHLCAEPSCTCKPMLSLSTPEARYRSSGPTRECTFPPRCSSGRPLTSTYETRHWKCCRFPR